MSCTFSKCKLSIVESNLIRVNAVVDAYQRYYKNGFAIFMLHVEIDHYQQTFGGYSLKTKNILNNNLNEKWNINDLDDSALELVSPINKILSNAEKNFEDKPMINVIYNSYECNAAIMGISSRDNTCEILLPNWMKKHYPHYCSNCLNKLEY